MAILSFAGNNSGSTFQNLGLSFSGAKQNTSKLSVALHNLKGKVVSVETIADAVALGNPASTMVNDAANREDQKKSALTVAYKKLDELVSNAANIDNKVAEAINTNKKAFYKAYSWLKPESEKGFFEKVGEHLWGRICSIGNAIKNIAVTVFEWCKEHWAEILIGLAFIVVGALITVFTAGTGTAFWAAFGAALLKGLATAAISGLVSGTISGTVTYIGAVASGMSPSEAFSAALHSFGDGFASGFKTGGLSFFGQSLGYVVETYKGVKAIHTIATLSDKLSNATDIVEYGSKIVNFVAPDSWLANSLNIITENPVYKKFSEDIGYVSTIFGGADKTAVVTKYDGKPSQYLEDGVAVKDKNSPYILTVDKDGKKSYKIDNGTKITEYEVSGKGVLKYSKTESRIYNIKTKKIIDKAGKKTVDLVTGNNEYVPTPSSNNTQINIKGISIPQIDISSINTSAIGF